MIGLHVPSPKRKATFNRMDHKLYLNTIQVFRLHVAERSVLVAQLCPTLWTPWTIVHHGPLSMEFSRQEHWSGLPCPSPGDLPDPGIEHWSPALQADSLLSELSGNYYMIDFKISGEYRSHTLNGEML